MKRLTWCAPAMAIALSGCGAVAYRVRMDTPSPVSIAVLPLQGTAALGLRDATRQLLHSRLQQRGYLVPELAWVDRVLSQHGWLRDPATVSLEPLAAGRLSAALQVDAVCIGTAFDESKFNILLLRRHAMSGTCGIFDAKGADYWSAEHAVSRSGGFLLASGQVITEVRQQSEHGTEMAALALADELIADLAETVPSRAPGESWGPMPRVGDIEVRRTAQDRGQRLVVTARGSPGCSLRFSVPTVVEGVPMVAAAAEPEHYRGEYDLSDMPGVHRVVVLARDRFGREAHAEVAP